MYNTIMLGTHIESIIASVMFNIELTFIAEPIIMNKQYNKLFISQYQNVFLILCKK